ncbi:MAG: fused MFS/spermidine synthase, partial [Planctomycetota bacterium]
AGFAVLVVEILGVHLLAPWFGASTVVWSQQIGLVLGAIALGGWLGGRRAAVSPDPRRDASWCLLVGGLLVVLCAFGLAPFAMWMLPEGLTLDQAAAGRGGLRSRLDPRRADLLRAAGAVPVDGVAAPGADPRRRTGRGACRR